MRRTAWTAILLGVTAPLLVAACSGGSKKSASSNPVTTPVPSASTAQPAANSDPFCQFVNSYNDRFGKVNLGLSDPAQLKATMLDAAASIKQAQAVAPPAIKSDVGLLSQSFQSLVDILQQANFDVTKVSLASIQQLQSADFAAASQRLDAYTRQNCL